MMPSFSLLDICGGEKDVAYGVESSALQKEDVARRGRGARTGSPSLGRDDMRCGCKLLSMGVATTDGGDVCSRATAKPLFDVPLKFGKQKFGFNNEPELKNKKTENKTPFSVQVDVE